MKLKLTFSRGQTLARLLTGSLYRTADLSGRHGQQPDHQAEQDQGRNQREQVVQRMEVEKGIACQTMFRRQHRGLLGTRCVRRRSSCLLTFSHELASLAAIFRGSATWIVRARVCSLAPIGHRDRLFLPAGPSARRGSRSGAALRGRRFPDRGRAVSSARLRRRVRWRRLRF